MILVTLSLLPQSWGNFFLGFIVTMISIMLATAAARMLPGNRTIYRDAIRKAKFERKRTKIELPGHKDPLIVGDVPHQAHWPKATCPHSRANVKGEG